MAYNRSKNQLSTVINHTAPNSWVLRDAEVLRLVKDYMQNFKNSDAYSKSVMEKYDWHLWTYVHHVATIQAEMLTGAKVGFDGNTLWGKSGDRAMANRFLDEQRGLCANGVIDVQVPLERIDAWKAATVHNENLKKNGSIKPINY